MSDALGLVLRLGLSLAVVLALMWLAARALRGPLTGRGSAVLEVVARQQLGRGAAVAVLRVADRALVVGVTDSKITLIAETDPEMIEQALQQSAPKETRVPVADPPGERAMSYRPGGPLEGSLLSPRTWRRAIEFLRERTVRR